jgi:hypothetical protein
MEPIRVGSSKWRQRAEETLIAGGPLRMVVTGWRARRLRRLLLRLLSPTANPGIADLILLFRFTMLFYQAVSRKYRVEMNDGEDTKLEVLFIPGSTNDALH